jgi:pimeloyl-ACP methyl ester carboxylesterase
VTTGSTATFVFVHGAFHGGWCWTRVTRPLQAAGHVTYSPSQTGLADRRHLLSAEITMDTFVADIENLIESEELHDVVLVSHSLGGRTAVGVADRIPERLAHLVFLDAVIPMAGDRLESMSQNERQARVQLAVDFDGGLSIPPPPARALGLTDPGDIAWVDRRMTPQPLSVERSPLTLRHDVGNGVPVTYLHCVDPRLPIVGASAAYARSRPGWAYAQLDCGHDAMVSDPGLVVTELLTITDTETHG